MMDDRCNAADEQNTKLTGWVNRLLSIRIQIKRGDESLLNISALMIVLMIACQLLFHHLLIPLIIVLFLIMGCNLSITRHDR